MKTYLTPTHRFACRQSTPLLTRQTSHLTLDKLGQIKFEFVHFYHNILGPEWSTVHLEGDYRHKLHFFRAGSARIVHQGQVIEMKPGYAYWEPSSILTTRHCDEAFEEYHLTFYCELIDGVDLFSNWPQRQPVCVGKWDMEYLEAQWNGKPFSLNALTHLQGMLYVWLATCFEDLEPIVSHHVLMFTRYAAVLEHCETQLSARLRITELADIYGTSLQAFSTAFTRDLGLNPKEYLNRRINQKACELIGNTDCSIKSVAMQLGFDDERYFSRFFSKMNGMPPKQYRQTFYKQR